jgi:hypothetical protein
MPFRRGVRGDVVKRKALHLVRFFLAQIPCLSNCGVVTCRLQKGTPESMGGDLHRQHHLLMVIKQLAGGPE